MFSSSLQMSSMTEPPIDRKQHTTKISSIEKEELHHPMLLRYLNCLFYVPTTRQKIKLDKINPKLVRHRATKKVINAAKAYGWILSRISGIFS